MKRMNKSALIGAFFAILIVTCFAARYEEFVVGKLTVENTATLESTLAVTGAITATGGVVGNVSGASSLGLSGGAFSIQNTTQLVFIVTGVATNVIDSDITTP